MKKVFKSAQLEIYKPELSEVKVPLAGDVAAGPFSNVDDFVSERIDINKLLIRHPEATFYARVRGSSMAGDFNDGDLLVVDRAEEWSHNRIALCYMDGEFTVKRIDVENGVCTLVPSNPTFQPIVITSENTLIVWGIVIYSIRKH
ncbi:MAG: translesion error-prone DNA polymerase V autoproteolytic subunit [Proteiniphilum sp.]|nr:translesion error-prone DNA polymerase V autoproteolytic subunit [Proteiniphilum sp.]MDD4453510.1 translesion error-prone DNA polymerase V autoproteolytic subunit [Proteiniphilum sp.]